MCFESHLVDQRILCKDNMTRQLQGHAVELEEQLRRRVPANYLEIIGVLLHDPDRIGPALQGKLDKLQKRAAPAAQPLRRRAQ